MSGPEDNPADEDFQMDACIKEISRKAFFDTTALPNSTGAPRTFAPLRFSRGIPTARSRRSTRTYGIWMSLWIRWR